ncbi:MAG: T9SS type A sorting domain-containing protein, partial [Candidatus Cloacimonetes bacterium]|nr:T9SS type A sorting domain-containing protein [Candidatus Cloacimonadota bacterium]
PIYARSQDFPDWELFVDAFGEDQCYWNPPPGLIIYSPFAVSLWRRIVFGSRDYDNNGNLIDWWDGSCYGFAISSLLAFDDKTAFLNEFPDVGNFTSLYELSLNNNRRKCINQLWIYQFGQDQLAHINSNKTKTPMQTLNEIKQMFLSEIRDDKILVFFNQNSSGGHAVNPYYIEKDSDNPNLEYIYVYDNNWPNNFDRKITINTNNNTWSYFASTNVQGQPVDWGDGEGLFLMEPVSNYLINPILPKSLPPRDEWISENPKESNYLEFYNTPNASIRIENQDGFTIGYSDSIAYNNFEDGVPIIPITGSFHPPIGYYILAGEYSIKTQDFSDSLAYFSVFTDSTVYSYSRSDANYNQIDYLNYGNSFVISSQDEQDKNISFESIAVNEDNEKVFEIENCSIFQNDSLAFDIVNQENFQISNKSQRKTTKTYDLRVRLVSANVDTIFEHEGIEISANSSHQVTPNWDNLDNIPILIDEDMNGTFDDTLYVENQFSEGETPSTGGALNNNNIYIYPNPFNPSIETGIIRYSLAKDGNVTIRIYDVAGNLVKILIENDAQVAGEEQYIEWDGKNGKGDIVANGVYFYVIESSSGEKGVGKIAIVK